jgi:hypothetical protein
MLAAELRAKMGKSDFDPLGPRLSFSHGRTNQVIV